MKSFILIIVTLFGVSSWSNTKGKVLIVMVILLKTCIFSKYKFLKSHAQMNLGCSAWIKRHDSYQNNPFRYKKSNFTSLFPRMTLILEDDIFRLNERIQPKLSYANAHWKNRFRNHSSEFVSLWKFSEKFRFRSTGNMLAEEKRCKYFLRGFDSWSRNRYCHFSRWNASEYGISMHMVRLCRFAFYPGKR
jgi:hypothetical protein